MSEEIIETNEEILEEEIVERVNPFCIISIEASEIGQHNIQTNSAWGQNPYPDTYAVVPDEMVMEIRATRGFCDIELNEEGTEVVSFTAREIPDIPEPEPEEPTEDTATWDAMAAAINEGVNEV